MPSKAQLNPRTETYHFFGPFGALFISLAVPTTLYGLSLGCSEVSGCSVFDVMPSGIAALLHPASLWDTKATLIYFAWYFYCVAAWYLLPGTWVQGTLLRDNTRKEYKMNGFATFLLTMCIAACWIAIYGPQSFTFIYERYVGLLTAVVLMALFQATACYISSFYGDKLLAVGGNSGNIIYDFFIGRELNPTIGSLELSSFNEVRPGLILWVLIDISMACEQAVRGDGRITDSMLLVVLFQMLYVADCLYTVTSNVCTQSAMLTTMDITTDSFGFMLAVGDFAWVPFSYSLQARYLVFTPLALGRTRAVLIFLFNSLGYYIFRDANNEKNAFRNGRNPKNLKYMSTKRGTKLLVSGWWGLCRHPNYLGDLMMGLAWSLPTGFNTPLTYFYIIYFTALLIHRQIRDDEHCEQKYGEDWKAYMKRVPYRIFPYIY